MTTTIEVQYGRLRAFQATRDLPGLLGLARQATTRLRDVRTLQGASRRRSLRRAVARLTSDDLDSAWHAALRGDLSLALDRISVGVSREPEGDAPGSPWRTRSIL